MSNGIKVHYLYHSGYAVEIDGTLLIFDYYLDKPDGLVRSMDTGVIEPQEIRGYNTIVFSSHRHQDHFNPVIFSWRQQIPKIGYILSWDIPKRYHQGSMVMRPGQRISPEDGVMVSTLRSTDAGVAFLVEVNGVTIYHAGDLNWWHWEEESRAWNNNMAARFKKEIDKLTNMKIDIAFLTTDPRQGFHSLLGLDYFLNQVGAGAIFPMHFWDDYSIMEAIEQKKATHPGAVIYPITRRGACICLSK